jgi:hypothetical protein
MTNGVQANVFMKRTAEPKRSTNSCKLANDPGKRLVIGGIIAEQATGKVKEVLLSSKEYNHATGYCERKVKMEEWSGHLEGIIRKRRETLPNIGPSSADFRTYVRF